ncbi:hypothetical protein QCA50_002645 [Cerrena zonata]|uniref:DUF6534 domain-containing protein n=1 Tax=Cerrena zonata TaxID=2478898 RepID=A0AAW0GPW3_9APHY
MVQGYYIWRIWILSNNTTARNGKIILVALLLLLLLGRLGFTIGIGVFSHFAGTWAKFQGTFAPNFCVLMTNSFSAVIDGIIAISMIFLLRRNQAGFNHAMDSVLRWIIVYSVNTGAVTTVVSVIIAITYSTLKENMVFLGLVALTAKLYANTLLGMLNARRMMRNKASASAEINASAYSGSHGSRSGGSVVSPSENWRRKSYHGTMPQAIIINNNRVQSGMRRPDSFDYNPKLQPAALGDEVAMQPLGAELSSDPPPMRIQVHTSRGSYGDV